MQIFMAGRVSHAGWEKQVFPYYERRLISFQYDHDLPTMLRVLQTEFFVEHAKIRKDEKQENDRGAS